MKSLSVILYIHNLSNRGHLRLCKMFESLYNDQECKIPFNFILCNESNDGIFDTIDDICKKYNALHLYWNLNKNTPWSKAKCLNYGIRNSDSEYIMLTDVDYIFAPNFFSVVKENYHYNRLLLCQVHYSNENVNFKEYNKDKYFEYLSQSSLVKKIAGGASQILHSDHLREINGYDERMNMWGGMDDDIIIRSKNKGLNIRWISDKTSIIHQWHFRDKTSGLFYRDKNAKMCKEAVKKKIIIRNNSNWGLNYKSCIKNDYRKYI